MKRCLIALMVVLSFSCAADVATSAGTAAEMRKQEMEAAKEKKEAIVEALEKQKEEAEKRKKELLGQ